ncbi:MAG TPA: hypothetical protein VF665_03665 [Longimicrobium sp.]|jgi:hypothetical protein|uniref:hypothetical protein n=1 Tax=Longimicrobium sp. TaxID=2029185 RepID=UPI002ED7BF3E
MIRPAFAASLLLALGACADEPRPSISTDTTAVQTGGPAAAAQPARPPSASTRIILAADGLRLADSSSPTVTELRFGMNQDSVVATLTARAGAPRESGTNEECGQGSSEFAAWNNGLTLWFTDRQFQGWALNPERETELRTERGIGLGSTRAALDSTGRATVNETSLGHEFEADSIYGVLSGGAGDARITSLWAGATCIFR